MKADSLTISPTPSLRSGIATAWGRLLRSRGGWALADQSVLSAGNFLSNLLLARSLPTAEFGHFAFVLAVLNLLNNLNGSIVGYQLTIRGAPAPEGELRRYMTAAMGATALLQVVGAAVLAGSLLSIGELRLLPVALATLAAWQLQETVRRALLAKLRYAAAVPGDVMSYLGQVALMWTLARTGHLTVTTALLCGAFSSTAAMGVQLLQVRVAPVGKADLKQTFQQGWHLGRWLLMANVVSVLVVPILPWALAYYQGPSEIASFQALAIVLGISHPVIFSVSNLIIPSAAQARLTGGVAEARRLTIRYALQGAAMLAPYYLGLLLVPELALRLLYGADSPYAHLGGELRLFVLLYVMYYASQVILALMNGLGNTSANFVSQVVVAVVTVGVTVPLGAYYGLTGLCWGRLPQGAAAVAVGVWLWARFRKSPAGRDPAGQDMASCGGSGEAP